MALTPKNEKYCQAYILLGDKSAAYREAYSTSKMSAKVIHNKASELSKKGEVRVRLAELREKLEKQDLYTLRDSIQRDLKLIERYEKALDVLENQSSKDKEIEAAERMIKFIGASGYNSAQERLSKQHGFFEVDNTQKNPTDTRTPEERDARINELIEKYNANRK